MRRLLYCCALVLAVTGCATVGSMPPTEVDNERVAAIERQARVVGVQVIWVNMPRKRVATPAS